MTTAYLALGANLGDRAKTLCAAITALGQAGQVQACSAFYDTQPEGGRQQPVYLNAALRLQTQLGPRALLNLCLRIEHALGRRRVAGEVHANRPIDIDVLLYGDRRLQGPQLTVPHPRLLQRPFVRIPLAEVAEPGLRHPISGERLDRSTPDASVTSFDDPGGTVPSLRVRCAHAAPVRPDGEWVLYWMTAAHRTRFNFALDRAVDWARALGKPLVVLECLRADYPFASDRLHTFYLQGMADNARRFARAGVAHHPFVAPRAGAEQGLVQALLARACVAVIDEFPYFIHPDLAAEAAAQCPVRLEQVDGNGLLPLRATEEVFTSALSFRRWLQRELAHHLLAGPSPDPLRGLRLRGLERLPEAVTARWPRASETMLRAEPAELARLPIDHQVHQVGPGLLRGGSEAGRRRVRDFVARLRGYAEDRNHPDRDAGSGLSPYLHFGQISSHEILQALAEPVGWTPAQLGQPTRGSRHGFWGLGPDAEAFLDQLVTWRELGFNFCAHRSDAQRYSSLPDWARRSLERHASDPRQPVYSLRELEEARTGDPLWNAAQRQLVREGRLHNYLRMLWGKRILEWSPHPQRALEIMFQLNDRYALDGRDPNSATGIMWVLGRYDHPWPERPIFGSVRAMSSSRTAHKVEVREYLRKYGDASATAPESAVHIKRGVSVRRRLATRR